MKKIEDRLHPGIPQRAQQRREKKEGACRAQQCRKKSVQGQPTRIDAQGEKKDAESRCKAIERIQCPGQAR